MRSTTHRLRNTRLLLTLVGSVALVPGVALAEAPTQQGWWSAGSAPVPGLPLGPTSPDVPQDGLLVEGTASSPTAYAAVSYVLAPDAVPESLVLTVAEGAATTPGATLVLHPLESPQFEAAQGGPLADAPAFDPERSVEATVDEAGTTFTFDDLGPLELTLGVAVAVLPSAAGGRVVLSAPDEESLTTSDGSSVPGGGLPTFSPPPSDGGFGAGTQVDDSGSAGMTGGIALPETSSEVLSSPQLAAALPPGTELPAVAEQQPAAAPVPETPLMDTLTPVAASQGGDGGKRLLAGLVILAAATATLLWAFAGGSDPDAPALPPAALPS